MIAPTPSVLGLFQKRVAGDDALLELANASFAKAGLKAELFADSVESVHHTLSYRPEPFEYSTLHLPRGLDVFEKDHERTAIEFIRAFSGKFSGFVLHDHPGAVEKGEQYASVIQKIASFLDGGSCLFIEYAAGLKFSEYIRLIQRLRPLKNVNSCIDIGHVALRAVALQYSKENQGASIFSLKKKREAPETFMPSVERAIESGPPAVLNIIEKIGAFKKPVHFHIHDGHPLSRISSYGLSDHLSFFEKIPIQFDYKGSRHLSPIFGPAGLATIVRSAWENIGPRNLSMTIEVHATEKRRKLENAACLFDHWEDLRNAERMNFWLWDLSRIHEFILDEFKKLSGGEL